MQLEEDTTVHVLDETRGKYYCKNNNDTRDDSLSAYFLIAMHVHSFRQTSDKREVKVKVRNI